MCLPRFARIHVIIALFTILLLCSAVAGCLTKQSKQDSFTEPRAYICNADSNVVSVLNPSSGVEVAKIKTQAEPLGVAVSNDGCRVYVSNGYGVSIVDARTNELTGFVQTRAQTTGYLIVSPDDKRLFVACNGGLSIIDLANDSGNETAFVEGVSAMGMATSKDGKYVYTTDWGPATLQVTNTQTGKIEKTIDLISVDLQQGTTLWQGLIISAAGQAQDLDVSPDGKHAIVGIWSANFVAVVDLEKQALERNVVLNGRSYQGVAYSPDGSKVYVSCYDDGRIVALDTGSYKSAGYFSVAKGPRNIKITPDGKYMYVAREKGKVEIIGLPDGDRVATLNIITAKNGYTIAFNPAAKG